MTKTELRNTIKGKKCLVNVAGTEQYVLTTQLDILDVYDSLSIGISDGDVELNIDTQRWQKVAYIDVVRHGC